MIYNLDFLLNHRITEVSQIVRALEATPIRELTICNLIWKDGQPLKTGRGVYCFLSEQGEHRALYVGKATSWRFVARVPMHFDRDGWHGHFAKRMLKRHPDEIGTIIHRFRETLFVGFEFNTDEEASTLAKPLEKVLQVLLNPCLGSVAAKWRDFINAPKVQSMTLREALFEANRRRGNGGF